jgi:hypothetical protein
MQTGGNGYWNLRDLLADLMGTRAEREPQPRAVIWASDLGKPYIDRWLQMKGVPYSNPPSGQDLMTFFLGSQIELGIEDMLTSCGLAYRRQEQTAIELEDCLPVVGRADLVLQVHDWDKLLGSLAEAPADEPPRRQAQRLALRELLGEWARRHTQGLGATAFEVKSLNSAAFKYHRGSEGLSNAYPHHKLQLYTYLRGLQIGEGHLLYVARDTGWMEEVVVRPTKELEAAWLQDVQTMSAYYLRDERPPLEPKQVEGKDNWRVTYSRYKDYLYQEVHDGAFAI